VRIGGLHDLIHAVRQKGAGELAPHQGEVPGVGLARGPDVDLIDGDHVASEDHRLEVEPAADRQQVRKLAEERSVNIVLSPGRVLRGGAEVLERAEAGRGVEPAEGVGRHEARVLQVDVEPMVPAGGRLRGGQCDAHAFGPPAPDEVQQRAPAATQVEDPAPGSDAYVVRHVLVLAPLGLFEAEREVTVLPGAAEVSELSQAQPEDAVDQGVGELEVGAVGHGSAPASAKVTSRPRPSSQSLRRTARRPSNSESVGTSWKIGLWSWARCRL
jgi:hypothetical protein